MIVLSAQKKNNPVFLVWANWFSLSIHETCCGVPKATITSKCQWGYGGTIAAVAPNDMTAMGTPWLRRLDTEIIPTYEGRSQ